MTPDPASIPFIYFGGEPIGVPVLEELHACGLKPQLVIGSPDKPVGRKQVLTPPPVTVWARAHDVAVWQPECWRGEAARKNALHFFAPLLEQHPDLIFVVVAYNHILPQWLLDVSPRGVINVHPSLLPKLRGASPIRTAIMNNLRDAIGVSIMLLDEKMDHGPILTQRPLPIADEHWPLSGPHLDEALARLGGAVLADTLPRYLAGEITPSAQDHDLATYCGRLSKADSELTLDPHNLPTGDAAAAAMRRVCAFAGIGDTWFMHNGVRIKITAADNAAGQFRPLTVVPAGKKSVPFLQWLHSLSD